MKKAYLYLRDNSQTPKLQDSGLIKQHTELRNYCTQNAILIDKIFADRCSALRFDRPGWQELTNELSASETKPDIILFTTWDRFSRNATEAVQVRDDLRRMGIEVMAILQNDQLWELLYQCII